MVTKAGKKQDDAPQGARAPIDSRIAKLGGWRDTTRARLRGERPLVYRW